MRLGVARTEKVETAGGRVGQWWTPTWLAEAAVEWARIPVGASVLDAGAGTGALTRALLARPAVARVWAVEIDRRHASLLKRRMRAEVACGRLEVTDHDFLAETLIRLERFDLSVQNPPWEGNLPMRFIARSLDFAARAVAIVPLNVLAGVERSETWDELVVTRMKVLARRAIFGGAGGGMRDVALLEVRRRGVQRVPGLADVVELEVGT